LNIISPAQDWNSCEFCLKILLITAEYISQPTTVYTSFAEGTLNISYVIHRVVRGGRRGYSSIHYTLVPITVCQLVCRMDRSTLHNSSTVWDKGQIPHTLQRNLWVSFAKRKIVRHYVSYSAWISQSVWLLARGWTVLGSIGEIFRTCPDRFWSQPTLMYNGYRVYFPGIKRQDPGVDTPHSSNAEVKERVELYLYSTSGPS